MGRAYEPAPTVVLSYLLLLLFSLLPPSSTVSPRRYFFLHLSIFRLFFSCKNLTDHARTNCQIYSWLPFVPDSFQGRGKRRGKRKSSAARIERKLAFNGACGIGVRTIDEWNGFAVAAAKMNFLAMRWNGTQRRKG